MKNTRIATAIALSALAAFLGFGPGCSSAPVGQGGGEVACTPPPGETCTMNPSCGCAAGFTCAYVSAGGAKACITAGEGKVGAACSAGALCGAGLVCNDGVCGTPCTNVGGACKTAGTAPSKCLATADAAAGGSAVGVCTIPCDPTRETACGDAPVGKRRQCGVWSGEYTSCIATTATEVPEGGACGEGKFCAAGTFCTRETSGNARCRRMCTLGSTACACSGFAPDIAVGAVTYGVCP